MINSYRFKSSGGGGYPPDAFVMTIEIPSDNYLYTHAIAGTVNVNQDWGDGISETVTTANPSHFYSSAGTYQLVTEGSISDISGDSTDKDLCTHVNQFGNLGVTDLQSTFDGWDNLISINFSTTDIDIITSWNSAFNYAINLETVTWPVGGSVFDGTYSMFARCYSLTDRDVLANLVYLRAVTQYMFLNCTGLTSLDVTPISFATCYRADGFFSGCINLTEITDLENKNMSTNRVFNTFLEGVTLSTTQYNNILRMSTGWPARGLRVAGSLGKYDFHMGNSQYDPNDTDVMAGRAYIEGQGYTIIDGGPVI